jgi:hypothetical protein
MHRYIQTKVEIMGISSLGVSYRYVVKIKKKFKKKRREFGSTKSTELKEGKGIPNP